MPGIGHGLTSGGAARNMEQSIDRRPARERLDHGEHAMPVRFRPHACPLIILLLAAGCAGLQQTGLDDLLGGGPLDEATVAAGLREALTVGSGRAVQAASTRDGFLGNAAIRLALPPELQGAAAALRDMGLGQPVDDLVVAMNRAAEQASGLALPPFRDAVARMTLADAFGILQGPRDAATVYFRAQTEDSLRARFTPVVSASMREVGLDQRYDAVLELYDRIPFVRKPSLDLRAYITDRTLDGLFTTLAAEEERIRTDPLARTTRLLQRVFGR